jgi:hypothetical protein
VKRPFHYRLMVLIANAWLFASSCLGQTPASELKAAYLDAAKLSKEQCYGAHYLSLYSIPAERRAAAASVLGWQLNALSRVRVITPITKDNYVSSTLIRIHFTDYALEAKDYSEWFTAWENMAFHDPTWHIQTEVLAYGKTKLVSVDGGWVGLDYAQKLKQLTGSNGPILRADYFIAGASHPPYYHDFAGIPATVDEFYKAFGLDQKTIERLRANAGANLIISGITDKDRHAQWAQGPLGGVYTTLDSAAVTADRSGIRRPLNAFGTNLKFDAGEYIAVGGNGLLRFALYDAKGKRQNSVPDAIAKDKSDPHGPGIVYPMASCVRCHVESGLRPFKDDQQAYLEGLRGYDAATILRIHEFYDEPRLQRQMNFDRETYKAACLKACGLEPKAVAEALATEIREYLYLPLGIEQAAVECGVSVDEFKFAMNHTNDPMLIALCNGRKVLRGQWSSSQAEAQLSCAAHIRRDGK